MSLSPSERTEARRNTYKVEADEDEGRRRREDNMVEIRKGKREESLQKKRRVQNQQLPAVETKLEHLPAMVAGVWTDDDNLQLEATTQFRKLLSIEHSPPIEEVIQAGVVPRFVEFLMREDFPQLQFEAAWALTNIASGTSENTKVVIDHGAVPIIVKLLGSPSDDVREQAVWALGNFAGDSPRSRDLVLGHGALQPLLAQLNENAKLSMLRNATWMLSNFCRGEPQPPFDQVKPALPALARLIHSNDEKVLTDACWALSYLSDGTNDKIQALIEARVCPRLVKLLMHPSPSVRIPAVRTFGNIATGFDMKTQNGVDPASRSMEKRRSLNDVIDAKPWEVIKGLVHLILQFLKEEKFEESAHKLEQESGIYFDMKYFDEKVQSGEWDEVEKYLSGFTKVDDKRYSTKIFFEIRKQKYFEALRLDKAKAAEILVTDLEMFSTFNEEPDKEITQFLTLNNFRENEQLPEYGDTKTARSIMLIELKKLIEANPLFCDKLTFPSMMKSSRLWTLIKDGLNWELKFSRSRRPNPDIKSLFTDHPCTPPNDLLSPTPVNLPVAAVAKPASYTSLGAHDNGVDPASRSMEKRRSLNDVIDAKPWEVIKGLVHLILQFLKEEKFEESAHKLEQESGIYFDMKYFDEKVQSGEWDEVEKYLSGFTKVDDNRYSTEIFFEIRKQKYFEALRLDKAKTAEILVTDLEMFSTFNEEPDKEITQFLTLNNFRENEQLPEYGDTKTARSIMLIELKKLIEANPLFCDKLTFPSLMKSSRMWTLVKDGLNWELQFRKNPWPNPNMKILFTEDKQFFGGDNEQQNTTDDDIKPR